MLFRLSLTPVSANRLAQKKFSVTNLKKELIEDKAMLLKMLQASVVLEYNGKRWHNVHHLVARFFKEQGLIQDVRE